MDVRKDLTQMELVFSENNKDAQKDTMEMLNIFDIHSNTKGIKIDISTDFESCLWFLENDLFIGHRKFPVTPAPETLSIFDKLTGLIMCFFLRNLLLGRLGICPHIIIYTCFTDVYTSSNFKAIKFAFSEKE